MKVIDDEEYEKNKIFTIVLEEPILLEVGQRHGELISSSKMQLHNNYLLLEINSLCIWLKYIKHIDIGHWTQVDWIGFPL